MRAASLALAALLAAGRDAHAAEIEFAPFVGFQFDASSSLGSGLDYGATLDVPVAPTFAVELLYSRQEAELLGGPGRAVEVSVERYLAGLVEEQTHDWGRFFGVFLLGLTRFAPGLDGYDADERFTLGLSLGAKLALSERFGLRGEARGFYVIASSGGGLLCRDGACLVTYSASGFAQGDVTAAVIVTF
ncbi:MAG TPA: hypothetical protein VFM88_18135 [Vicinamibacteria bacterium]|nr:hypothetical protein [Vicinamibacteria bacterium]